MAVRGSSAAPLYQNRIYRGEITHKGNAYPGEHPAIVEKALWDEVQAVLTENRVDRATGSDAKHPSLLADAPDPTPVEAWLRRFAKGTCDDLVLMTGEGLRRLLGFARRLDMEPAFLNALGATRKITRGPKPVRALREIGLAADVAADEPTTEGVTTALQRFGLNGRRVGLGRTIRHQAARLAGTGRNPIRTRN